MMRAGSGRVSVRVEGMGGGEGGEEGGALDLVIVGGL